MINAQLSKFLIDIALNQQERVKNIVAFLTKAEDKILNQIDLDNLPIEQMGTLAKTVNQLQTVLLDMMEMMRKLSINDVGISGNLAAEEIAHFLSNLDPVELEILKQKLNEVRRLKVVKK